MKRMSLNHAKKAKPPEMIIDFSGGLHAQNLIRKIAISKLTKICSIHAFKPAGLLEDGLGNAWRLGVFSGCGIDVAPNGSTGDGVQILIGNRVKMAAGAIKKVAFGDGCSRKKLLGSALANGDKTVLSGLDSHGCAPCGLRTV